MLYLSRVRSLKINKEERRHSQQVCWGNLVRDCVVVASTKGREDGACCRCFVGSIGGRNVHKGIEFGRKGICLFETLTGLVMTGYSVASIDRKLVCRFVLQSVRAIPSAQVFADWLLKDHVYKHSMLFNVVQRVRKKLRLEKFEIE